MLSDSYSKVYKQRQIINAQPATKCSPLRCVLVAITVVGLINVSVVRTEARARPNQARCSGLQISFLGGTTQLAATRVWFPFSPSSIHFHIKTTSDFRGSQERLFHIYYPGFTDSHRFSEAFLMKLKSVISQRGKEGVSRQLMDHTSPPELL